MKIVPIILLGGSGTRLWPISRKNHPKQFLNLIGDNTLLQSTVLRLDGIDELDTPIVICNEEHRFTTAEQLTNLGRELGDIILEPVGKNTAPAVTIGALRTLQKHDDAILLVLPADHVIKNVSAFHDAVDIAVKATAQDKLVTFGIVPSRPETGYGYIKSGSEFLVKTKSKEKIFHVEEFVEKPDKQTANRYLESGNYYWNSGIFMFKASVFLNEIKLHQPDIFSQCQLALEKSKQDLDFIRLNKDEFLKSPSDSIDYAVMEHSENVVTVHLDANWNDVGSWDALWEVEDKTPEGNVLKGDVLLYNSQNCLVHSEHKLVTLVGLENTVVIETKDAVLVAAKTKVQDVKQIVEKLRANKRTEAELHREVYRPWGKYDGVDTGDRFQVKRITVKPGQSTSVQMHYHRAEHWIIVSGMAEITCDDKTFLCRENQSAFIPQGSRHRIANPGKLPMEMIEVQTGSYLGEDDIVRFEDQYGRSDNSE